MAAKGILPVWRTTPINSFFRDSGLSLGLAVLKEAKFRFAMKLQTVDNGHPLIRRILPLMIIRGKGVSTKQRPKIKVQCLGIIFPSIPRLVLTPPHFTPECRTDPTGGIDKEQAAIAFKK